MTRSIPIVRPPDDVLDDLCRRYGIKELALFGSIVRGDFHADSDIDVLVEFQPGIRNGLFAFVRLQRELESILGREVDLVPKDGLKPYAKDHLERRCHRIYPIPRSSDIHDATVSRTSSVSEKLTDL